MNYFSYADALCHVYDYVGSGLSDSLDRDARRAVISAYRDLVNAHHWTYLYRHGRIVTNGTLDSGTLATSIQYQHAGGTYPRQVTLSGGTWPSWASDSYLRVGMVSCRVDRVISGTVLTLDDEINPGSDLPSGTTYAQYQDTYLLPADFREQDQALYERNFGGMSYTHPREWLYENRFIFGQGTPTAFTITGDRKYAGRLVMRVFPYPMDARTIDFIYQRRPRALGIASATAGSLALASGANAVVGTGTNFTPAMVGSVLRASASSAPPTGDAGANPAAFESLITSWADATHVTTADNAPLTQAACPYEISDPIELELGAMLNAFQRCLEHHISMSRAMKDKPSARLQYATALGEAKAADSRCFTGRAVGRQNMIRQRLRDMPVGPDQS